MESTYTENKMGYLPIRSLIVKMSLPMMVSMLVLALYNIVDSIYVSRISENALTAVSLVFPYQMLINAVAVGTAVGANSLVARRLGEKRQQEADSAASNAMFLAILGGLVFALLFSLLRKPMIAIFHAEAEIAEYAVTYLSWVGIPCIFVTVQVMCEKILQATGSTLKSMFIQLAGAVFNIVFDPILIFGLYGFPKLGVAGAAIATIGGQCVGMLLGLSMIASKSCLVQVRMGGFKPNKAIIGEIYDVGVPSIFLQMVGTVMTLGLNKILIAFSSTAVSVLGVYFKLQSFVFMPVFGLNSGTMPIIGYNYGAQNKRRIMEALKYGCIYAFAIMCIGLAVFQFRSDLMLGLFKASDEMLAIGVPALRIISLSFPLAALTVMCTSLFQAIGDGRLSFFCSALRQLVILLPVAFLLSRISGLDAVWYAFPIAEIFAVAYAGTNLYRIYQTKIKPMPDK